jgi:hypothetical protein
VGMVQASGGSSGGGGAGLGASDAAGGRAGAGGGGGEYAPLNTLLERVAHSARVSAVVWGAGPSSKWLFSAGWDRTTIVWPAEAAGHAQRPVATFVDHVSRVTALAVAAGGRALLSCSADMTCVLRSLVDPNLAPIARYVTLSSEGGFTCLSAGLDSFVCGTETGQLRVWPLPPALCASERAQAAHAALFTAAPDAAQLVADRMGVDAKVIRAAAAAGDASSLGASEAAVRLALQVLGPVDPLTAVATTTSAAASAAAQ